MRLSPFACLYLLLACLIVTGFVNCQMTFNDSLTAGAYWTYQGYRKSETSGISGECAGSFTYVESMQGRVTVKALNESALDIEDHKDVYTSTQNGCSCHTASAQGSIFKPNRHYTQNVTTTIDRRTLTYTSYVVDSEYRSSLLGRSAEYFLPTAIEGGPHALYSYNGQEIFCSIGSRKISFQGVNVSTVTLHYNGPIKLSLPFVAEGEDVDLEGIAEYAFDFESSSGLLVSYAINETTVIIGSAFTMSPCSITSTNTGNYTVRSTSWNVLTTSTTAGQRSTVTSSWRPIPNQTVTTPISPTSNSTTLHARNQLPYLAALAGIVALTAVGFGVIRRRISRRT